MLQEESLAAMELEYEIQRKITSAALRLANDGSPSKAVKRQRKMIYQQSLQQLKVTTFLAAGGVSKRRNFQFLCDCLFLLNPPGYRNETAFVAPGRNVQQHASAASSTRNDHEPVEQSQEEAEAEWRIRCNTG